MRREISAGGLVFRRDGKNLRFLLIRDHADKWALPKGIIGDTIRGETSEDAALREISEETGLKNLKIISKLGDTKYIYTLKGEKIFKIVRLFLVETTDVELKPQWEIKDAKWFSAEDATESVGYANIREIVKNGIRIAKSGFWNAQNQNE